MAAATAFSGEPNKALPLWPEGKVPDAKGVAPADIPDITVYKPANANGAAVVICPGGGYGALCSSYEGHGVAKWLGKYGITGVVLKYRVAPYRHPVPLEDASRAMRTTRFNAKEWGIDPAKIGIVGFSAGGHLAATLSTHFDAGNPEAEDPIDRMSSRPDFEILVYPVITMGVKTHGGSLSNLFGKKPSQAEKDNLSCELQVTDRTPMAFVAHSIKDQAVPVENSRMYVDALKAKGVSVEYLELPKGLHGLGCGIGEDWEAWQAGCLKWLKEKGLAN